MADQKNKVRIIMRQVIPRKELPAIPRKFLEEFIADNRSRFSAVVYIGWIRKKIGDKKNLHLLVSTGQTAQEARHRFKYADVDDEQVWCLI